jgi:AAA domain
MATTLSSLVSKANPKPPIVLIHGLHGLGKTSFGASAPDPVAILTEDGVGKLDMPHFPKATCYQDVMDAIAALYNEEHPHKTLVFDSIDHLEPMVWAEACARNSWSSIEQPGYGKGYIEADAVWSEFFDAMAALRDDKGMIIYMIAHTVIVRYESPETEPYDRFTIKLHKRASALAQEKADIVFFLNQRASVGERKDKKSQRASGHGPRTLYSERRPAFEAKNRFDLPPEIPLGSKETMGENWDNILNCVYN